jgi:hypothetical protein
MPAGETAGGIIRVKHSALPGDDVSPTGPELVIRSCQRKVINRKEEIIVVQYLLNPAE